MLYIGLWPQYTAGGYPQSCTTEPFNASVPYEIGWDTMVKYWVDASYAESDPNYNQFWGMYYIAFVVVVVVVAAVVSFQLYLGLLCYTRYVV